MDTFASCHQINDLIIKGDEAAARDVLIKLLANLELDGLPYTPVVNRLIRDVGLFPYLDIRTSTWEDRYVYEAFKVDVGEEEPVTLHREQSRLLYALLSGKNIAVSAPTSFGKSFVIDSFISIKRPKTVVILVPTIALADETRRRLQRKFGSEYKIITTADQPLGENNILIFPQERAISYIDILDQIDMLIVDEFYKASKSFDKERSPALLRAIIKLGKISSQRYYLAPNISKLTGSIFTKDMEFLLLDFKTVFLEKMELYADIGKDEEKKGNALLGILAANPGKSLIYAGTYTNISKIANILMENKSLDRELLSEFQAWLGTNYDANWQLTKLVTRGVGIHNGQLHRSLSQIQIRLFEEENGIDSLISTSSIIEGVNTSAQNVILWSNKNGKATINDFTYKNIIGRGGRMFKHFIGKVFVLEEPPNEEMTQLKLEIPDELLGIVDEDFGDFDFTKSQIETIRSYENRMRDLVGEDNLKYFKKENVLQSSDSNLILKIAESVSEDDGTWNGLGYLNSANSKTWDRLLYSLIKLQPGIWEIQWGKYVEFVKVLSNNWKRSIPELLDKLSAQDIGINEFFKLERNTTYKLSALLSDVFTIYNRMYQTEQIDLTPALSRISHAFLPPIVYQLEEYGLPRMVARKINKTGIINLERKDVDMQDVLDEFKKIGPTVLQKNVGDLDKFDSYILKYFYEGI